MKEHWPVHFVVAFAGRTPQHRTLARAITACQAKIPVAEMRRRTWKFFSMRWGAVTCIICKSERGRPARCVSCGEDFGYRAVLAQHIGVCKERRRFREDWRGE